MTNPAMVLSRGFGIRNVTNLEGIRKCLDNLMPLNILGIDIPWLRSSSLGFFCLFVLWFRGTKLGQDMRAVGQT